MLTAILKKIFLNTGVYAGIRNIYPNYKLAILRYHSIYDPEKTKYTSPAIALSLRDFEKHVQYFSKHYNVISYDTAIDYILQQKKFPRNSLTFTFDDGYADNYQAARILKKYNLSGTFFITTEPIDRKSLFWLSEIYMILFNTNKDSLQISWNGKNEFYQLNSQKNKIQVIRELVRVIKSNNKDVRESIRSQVKEQLADQQILEEIRDIMLTRNQVKEMLEWGMIIGSHTLTHLNLPNAEPDEAVFEINESKKVLEDILKMKVRHFSYPNSGPYAYYNEKIRQYVVNAGYESACTSNQGFVDLQADVFALERIRTVPQLEQVVHTLEWERLFS